MFNEDLMYGTVRSAGDPPVGRKAVEDERSQGLRDAVKPLNFGIPHGIFVLISAAQVESHH